MPTFTMTKNWDDGTVLTESQLDDIKTSVETFFNTTKIDSTNIQSGGIATANYAALSVDAAAIAASAVTTAKINDAAVTAAKIATGVITQVKMGSVGQQISSSSVTFTTTSSSYTDITNLSVSITTTGRPVFLGLIPDGSGSGVSFIGRASNDASCGWKLAFVRGSTVISEHQVQNVLTGVDTTNIFLPPGAYYMIDVPSAATYTYKVQIASTAGTNNVQANYCKLIAYEL